MENISIEALESDSKYFVSELMSGSLIEEYGEPPDISNIDELITFYYARPDSVIFVLKEDNVLAGFTWLIQSTDTIMGTKFCCILYLAVKKDFRGKKYSKMLLEKAINYSKENGVEDVRLSVRSNNDKAVNIYKSIGFATYKYEMKLVLDNP